MRKLLIGAAVTAATLLAAPAAMAQTEIEWWHAMGGRNGELVDQIAASFNEKQSDYVVKPVYKGNYTETLNAAIAAFRAGEPPAIVQVFEVGTATMMAAKGAIYPVYQLMEDAGEPFDQSDYLPAVISYYTTTDGKLLSMPFNSSTPVMWYNKDAFKKAGLDPDAPPKTWSQVAEYSREIVDAGYPCGFSFGWQSWVQLENFSAWHNVPFATKENGFAGTDTELVFNSPLHVRHIQNIADWGKEGLFKYGGRRGDSLPMFNNAECAMWMNSSAYYGGIKSAAQFDFGIAKLPYYEDVDGAPQNSIIGGATLWVMQGKSDAQYKAVAKFFTHLSSAEIQAMWHQETGYLPITLGAYELSKKQGFYEKEPGTDVAIQQMTAKQPTPNSKGLRLGNFVQIRDVINEELEAVWNGDKSAQEGLDTAVERGNELLRQFEKATN
jgi:sn-glycerol 3-phosphate transport system substrate-binding protein